MASSEVPTSVINEQGVREALTDFFSRRLNIVIGVGESEENLRELFRGGNRIAMVVTVDFGVTVAGGYHSDIEAQNGLLRPYIEAYYNPHADPGYRITLWDPVLDVRAVLELPPQFNGFSGDALRSVLRDVLTRKIESQFGTPARPAT